jgi:SAM-dependent methyltransferase
VVLSAGVEIDLLIDYPSSPKTGVRTEEDKVIARRFGREFFDGSRNQGYGGYTYHPKYFEKVARLFCEYYELDEGSKVLDVGCAKGFLLYEFHKLGMKVRGIDISEYAIQNCKPEVKSFLSVGEASSLPFRNKSFDLVVSLGTIHNLDAGGVVKALKEIERVGKSAFVTVDSYRNEEEKKRMEAWNLTAKTIYHVKDWESVFEEAGYTGDWYWITA